MTKQATSGGLTAGLVLACSIFCATPGSAGPPFLTDDPEPVELGHHEFYTYSIGTSTKDGTTGFLPAFEFNYGVIPNGQIHIIAAAAFDRPASGPTTIGCGDTELGFKYRFIDEDKEGSRPQVGVFPLIELPTGDVNRGLGDGHLRVFLPVWVQKSFGDWTTYGGGGYWINQDERLGEKDYTFVGWLLQRKVTDNLMLGGEIFHGTAGILVGYPSFDLNSKENTGFNIGGVYDFDDHNHLLFSAGRGLQNAADTNQFSWYLGWQITW
jgi:hypothetical protein